MLLGVSTWAMVLVVAWVVRGVLAPQWWLVSGVVFRLLYNLTSYANAPNPLDRPPNPGPLRIVNMLAGNMSVLSFVAAAYNVLPMLF